jgi:transcriptional regulator with XRE-family HTH domain
MLFYDKLEAVAHEKGVSVYRVFKDLGLSVGIMSALKSGKTQVPSFKTLNSISNYLGVPSDYILNYGEKQEGATPGALETESEDGSESFGFAMYQAEKKLSEEEKQYLIRLAREMINAKE